MSSRTYWEYISNTGIEWGANNRARKKIRLLNQVYFMGAFIGFLYAIIDLLQGLWPLSTGTALMGICFLTGFCLNKRGFLDASRILNCIVVALSIAFYASLLGLESGIIFFYFPLMAGIFSIFHAREVKQVIFVTSFTAALLVFLTFTEQNALQFWRTEAMDRAWTYYYNLGFSILSTSYIVYQLVREGDAAEERIIREKNKLNSVISNTQDAIWLVNTNYELEFFNNTFNDWIKNFTGRTPYQGMNIIRGEGHTLPEWTMSFRSNAELVMNKMEPLVYEETFHYREADMQIEISMNPIIEDGKIFGISCFGKNISEHKHIEEELRKAKNKAELASQAKSTFLSNMSHELRTPLNAIYGLTQILQQNKRPTKDEENLKVIKYSAEQLLVQINDILDLSKIESGELKFENHPFTLSHSIRQVWKTFLFKADEKGINLFTYKDPALPVVVEGDHYRFSQVLSNLLSNALKFTNEGYIKLRLTNKKQLDNNSFILRCEVEDTGIGIPEEKQKELFESFKQVDTKYARQFQGTGLGLAICKKIVEKQQGIIGVESTYGTGSTFYFEIPMTISDKEEATLKEEDIYEELPDQLHAANVLLVEDNEVNQLVCKQIMNALNIPLTIVGSGESALEEMQHTKYDIVLLDLQMPGMDGFEVCKKIRNHNGTLMTDQAVPIIAVSADIFPETKEKASRLGFSSFIEKPFKLNDLTRAIENAVNVDSVNSDSCKSGETPSVQAEGDQGLARIKEQIGMNDQEFEGFTDILIRQTREDLAHLKASIQQEDRELAGKIAHKLKSTFSSIGQDAIATLCFEIEMGSKNQLEQDIIAEKADRLIKNGNSYIDSIA